MSDTQALKQVTLPVEGMTCAACSAKVEKALKALPGVANAAVNQNLGRAKVDYDPAKLALPQIITTISDLGYPVGKSEISLKVSGMHCAACVNKVEKALGNLPGVSEAVVSLGAEKAKIKFIPGVVDIPKFKEVISQLGFEPSEEVSDHEQLDREQQAREEELKKQKRNMWFSWTLGLIAMAGTMRHLWGLDMYIPEFMGNNYFLWAISTPVVFGPARQFFIISYQGLKRGVTDMNLLYATGIGSAYLIAVVNTLWPEAGFGGAKATFYESAVLLTAFIILGRYLEALTRGRTSEAIRKLMSLQAKTARVIRNGTEIEIAAGDVEVGDLIQVRPGDSIPVDGKVLEGYSAVDEAMITGESIPVEKKAGDDVIGGTINKTGTFKFSATRIGRDTALAQIIKLVENAQASKAPIQKVADVVAGHFILVIHLLSLVVFLFWFFIGYDRFFFPESHFILSPAILSNIGVFGFSMLLSLSVLVISCPCAVGLATPSAIMAGSGKGAENGIIFKGAEAIENTSKLTAILFDKTGTLTKGEPSVTDIIPLASWTSDQILSLAASAEKGSEHPLGEAIVNGAKSRSLDTENAAKFEAIPGRGIEAVIGARSVLLGNRRLMEERDLDLTPIKIQAETLEEAGKTVMFMALDGQLAGLIAVADTLKETSAEAVKRLKKMGILVGMITGDNKRTAEAIGRELGLDYLMAEVLPEDKAQEVKKLQDQGKRVAMVGDGINDAPALAQANVGIAIGSGTDVAKETGEVILIKNDIRDVVGAIEVGRATMNKVKQNLFWAFIYNSLGIPIAAGILYPFTGWLISPELAALFMSISSFSVTMNTLLLKKFVPSMKRVG